ncbi:hypothetical protein SP99_01106 [Enterobacter sp. BIDMC92]|nr:hypothetical protein SP99_01106 [Enterobacter sp. BIDMC92]
MGKIIGLSIPTATRMLVKLLFPSMILVVMCMRLTLKVMR